MLTRTPLDEFIDRLRRKARSDTPIGSTPRHVQASEDNSAWDKHLEHDTKLDAAVKVQKGDASPVSRGACLSDVIVRLLEIPLGRFELEGCPMEVRAGWFQETLWWVPTEKDAGELMREGVSRGRIWTAHELMDLLAIPILTKDQVWTIALAKAEFGGEVVGVLNRQGDPPRPAAGPSAEVTR